MLKKFIMVLAFIGMASLATGCVVEVEEADCVYQTDCPVGSFCDVLGDCVEGCVENINCDEAAGEFCDAVTGMCSILVLE